MIFCPERKYVFFSLLDRICSIVKKQCQNGIVKMSIVIFLILGGEEQPKFYFGIRISNKIANNDKTLFSPERRNMRVYWKQKILVRTHPIKQSEYFSLHFIDLSLQSLPITKVYLNHYHSLVVIDFCIQCLGFYSSSTLGMILAEVICLYLGICDTILVITDWKSWCSCYQMSRGQVCLYTFFSA